MGKGVGVGSMWDAKLHRVAEYRKFARDCRSLAAMLTTPEDRRALELMAIGWEKTADERETILRAQRQPESSAGAYEATCGFRPAIGAKGSGRDR
jgi:hypothetical protein